MNSDSPFIWIHIPGSILSLVTSGALLTLTAIFFRRNSTASWAMMVGFILSYTSDVIDLVKRLEFLQRGDNYGIFQFRFYQHLTTADLFGKLIFCAGLIALVLQNRGNQKRAAELEAILTADPKSGELP